MSANEKNRDSFLFKSTQTSSILLLVQVGRSQRSAVNGSDFLVDGVRDV
jgi:hypothetical protein